MDNSFFVDRHAGIDTDVDALLMDGINESIDGSEEILTEDIVSIADLDTKLQPLLETEILDFMSKLRGGTFFNMGMFSMIKPNAANKHKRIYKITNMSAIVSGVDYENIGTTKEFRDRTGETPGGAWYDHKPGYEHRVGVHKKAPSQHYVLWKYDDKKGRKVDVWYFVVDTLAGTVDPVSLDKLLEAEYLTDSVKKSLLPKKVTGIDLTSGELVVNETNWRTAAFEHIFWLSQGGANPMNLGTKFLESLENEREEALTESDNFFVDRHAGIDTDVDSLLESTLTVKDFTKDLKELYAEDVAETGDKSYDCDSNSENYDIHINSLKDIAKQYDKEFDNLSHTIVSKIDNMVSKDFTYKQIIDALINEANNESLTESRRKQVRKNRPVRESYRRTVSRGSDFIDNELFVDFD